MGDDVALWKMDRPRCHVPNYDRDLATAGFRVGVRSCNINSVQ